MSRLQIIFFILNLITAKNISSHESWSTLFQSNQRIHATPHITNIIRNGPDNLKANQIKDLEKLNIHFDSENFLIERPDGLSEVYTTDHFKFHFTSDGSYNSVDHIDYVISMGNVFENVWKYHKV